MVSLEAVSAFFLDTRGRNLGEPLLVVSTGNGAGPAGPGNDGTARCPGIGIWNAVLGNPEAHDRMISSEWRRAGPELPSARRGCFPGRASGTCHGPSSA